MGSYGTALRLGVLLLVAASLIAAIYARREESADPGNSLAGLTGQRRQIVFALKPGGRPTGFITDVITQCPGDPERPGTWSPSDGAPVPFVWRGRRLTVRESKTFAYDNGFIGVAHNTMEATVAGGRIDGTMRSIWRFEKDGREYLVCDSGNVPFVAGDSFSDRLGRAGPVRQPWTLYPPRPARHTSPLPNRSWFARRVDDTCARTWRELDHAWRTAARRWHDHPDGRLLVEQVYVRYHAAQLRALVHLGDAPSDRSTYAAWLGNFKERVALERLQLEMLRRHDLDGAAALAARLATLKARGNAAGIAFGLKTCTSIGPEGGPRT